LHSDKLLEFAHPNALLFKVWPEGTGNRLGHVLADAALLLGETAPVNLAAFGRLGLGNAANFAHNENASSRVGRGQWRRPFCRSRGNSTGEHSMPDFQRPMLNNLALECLNIRVDHDLYEVAEAGLRFPTELGLGLGGIADQEIDFGGALVAGVVFYVF